MVLRIVEDGVAYLRAWACRRGSPRTTWNDIIAVGWSLEVTDRRSRESRSGLRFAAALERPRNTLISWTATLSIAEREKYALSTMLRAFFWSERGREKNFTQSSTVIHYVSVRCVK